VQAGTAAGDRLSEVREKKKKISRVIGPGARRCAGQPARCSRLITPPRVRGEHSPVRRSGSRSVDLSRSVGLYNVGARFG